MKTSFASVVGVFLLVSTQRLPAPVAYANLAISPGYNLIANPLSAGLTNGANEIMAPIDGEAILTYNGTNFDYTSYNSALGGWVDLNSQPSVPPALPPGRGFFFFNPGPKTNIVFTGRIVPDIGATNSLRLPSGYSLVGSPLPANVTNLTLAPVNLPLIDGMIILTWNSAGYGLALYDNAFGGWVDENFISTPPPAYNIGQGFFIFNPGPPVAWVQSLP